MLPGPFFDFLDGPGNEVTREVLVILGLVELVVSYLDFPVSRSNFRFTSSTGPYLAKYSFSAPKEEGGERVWKV